VEGECAFRGRSKKECVDRNGGGVSVRVLEEPQWGKKRIIADIWGRYGNILTNLKLKSAKKKGQLLVKWKQKRGAK